MLWFQPFKCEDLLLFVCFYMISIYLFVNQKNDAQIN